MDVIASYVPYDLGLIKLATELEFNDRVKAVSLPKTGGIMSGKFKLNYNLVLSGWGSMAVGVIENHPKVLYTVRLPVVPNKVCQLSLRTLIPGYELQDTQICTRPLDGAFAGCIVS
jgi:hypothetical protein